MRKLISLLIIFLAAPVFFVAPVEAKKTRTTSAKEQLEFGVNMARRQLWSEALFRFEQAAKLEPTNARVYNNLAVACEATGRFDEALEFYRQALRLAPSDRTVKANYSRFVEFYQTFKPEDEEESSATDTGAAVESQKAGAE
ncbi:MAG: tetratricopeptide repeat protein [Deltaproteobacteria bacterium]|nr:tetratricopeptide repeat protein [Deltaproteobacteria bacterium]